MSPTDAAERVVILNPASGGGERADAIRSRAHSAGYAVRETEAAGDAVRFAREAAEDGASVIVAAGGDGTLNEVVRGVDRADAFGRVTVAVVPAGTGNNFAGNVGVRSVDEGFAAVEAGERRRIDLGRANGHPFVNSCVGGLTAEASGETTAEAKRRLGVLAYVVATLRSAPTFEALQLSVRVRDGDAGTSPWTGEAVCVLVGNGRRFTTRGSEQADMEDGRFDVTVVEDVSAVDLMSDAVVERLLGQDARHTTRFQATALELAVRRREPIAFSLDGELVQYRTLSLGVQPRTLRVPVGEGYEPDPDE